MNDSACADASSRQCQGHCWCFELTITLESDLTVVQPPAVPLVDSCCHRKAAAVGAIRAHE